MVGAYRIILGVAAAMCAGCAFAQSASQQTQASVVIVDPPQLAKHSEIVVAPITRPGPAGAVTAHAIEARYAVSGVTGDTYTIVMPSSLKLVRSGGAEEVLLQLSPSGAMTTLTGVYGARSTGAVGVQGAVGVPGDTRAGVYAGSFPVILSLD